ncbi:hypothetical protein J5751_04215 [bacterium]|nr:hypothetical protein [bacterium]
METNTDSMDTRDTQDTLVEPEHNEAESTATDLENFEKDMVADEVSE